ncbi:MAG TPA: NUDIX domain-containing protein [Candidatus Saccharimonadales bacterium]|jgi:8-oxo-dGTP pyrophosphatase MutT (NUDIX family)|nr:NUDIX domain-containing protein [Candidatus Saccharimonadales bacterium]
MAKECDHLSVGVIIEKDEKIALLRRANFPIAISPPAGHVDGHGSLEQTAVDEVFEELGLIVPVEGLINTDIVNRRVENKCQRIGGDHHSWTVYRATDFGGNLNPSPDETRGAGWYDKKQYEILANRTRQMREGILTPEEWRQNPGLEEVWLGFLSELGYIN